MLLVQFYHYNPDMFSRLARLDQPVDPEQEKCAWEQATSAIRRHTQYEFLEVIVLVLIPITAYGYFSLHLQIGQIVYLSLGLMAAGLSIFLLENQTLDQLFAPVIKALLPTQLKAQIEGIKGSHLWEKSSFIILGSVILSLLLMVPTAYHQAQILFSDISSSPQLVVNASLTILKAGFGAVVIGLFLSIQRLLYLSSSFRRMINLFSEIEKGDLNQRIPIYYPDEFGKLNIFINHTIDRLQGLTSTLEKQVVERTSQLSRVNEQLLIELTERERIEEQLAFSALHDPLTCLPNRGLFMDRLHFAMDRARQHVNSSFAVLFLDLDRFKVVNDSLGHDVGDLLLIESARRLISCVRSGDSVARISGDEFVILLEDMNDFADCIHIANRILYNISLPANLEGKKVFVSVSVGIVFSDSRYERAEDILRDADIAMYQAKRQGRGRFEIFNPTMFDRAMTRLELEADLRRSLENQEFVIHYQPILNLKTRRIVGFEALVRWQHPTRGLTSPAEFIPTAEEIGLIVPLGYWILNEACHQMHVWHEQYPSDPPLTINVNLSSSQCSQPDLIEKITEILQKNQLDPSCLNLELTESLIVKDFDFTSEILLKLRELGIQVQIDDFGTGYSSLGYLHTLPIDMLKIDRTFINQLGTNNSGSEIVRTILALAHGLGMQAIAEGVETEDQLTNLEAMNCEYVQGFLFSKAVDGEAAGTMLRNSYIKPETEVNDTLVNANRLITTCPPAVDIP